jgi:hypothetical protein
MLLETSTAKHRSALGRLEGNRGLGTALRTGCARLRTNLLIPANALCLALLAALGIVLELLVVEEDLLARCKDKI